MNFLADAGELTDGLELVPCPEVLWVSRKKEVRGWEAGGLLNSGSTGGSMEVPTMAGSSEREISLSSSTSRLQIKVR